MTRSVPRIFCFLITASFYGIPLAAQATAGDIISTHSVQLDDYEACGATSLYAVARLLGRTVEFDQVRSLLGEAINGLHSFQSIVDASKQIGLHAVGLKLGELPTSSAAYPLIAHLNHSLFTEHSEYAPHYVVVISADEDSVTILDAPFPVGRLDRPTFESLWTGNVLSFRDDASQHVEKGIMTEFFTRTWSNSFLLGLSAANLALLAIMACTTDVLNNTMKCNYKSWKWWASAVALCGAIAFGSVLMSSWNTGAAASSAILAIPDDSLFLGEYPKGTAEAEIDITNSGNFPLRIERIASSCSCVTPKSLLSIEPGQTNSILITLDVKTGTSNADLLLYSNDPASPKRLSLSWSSKANDSLAIYPPRIFAHGIPVGRTYERSLRLYFPGTSRSQTPTWVRFISDIEGIQVAPNDSEPVLFATTGVPGHPRTTLSCLNLDVSVPKQQTAVSLKSSIGLVLMANNEEIRLDVPLNIEFVDTYSFRSDRVLFTSADSSSLIGSKRALSIELASNKVGLPRVTKAPNWLKCAVAQLGPLRCQLEMEVIDMPSTNHKWESIELDLPSSRSKSGTVGVMAAF